MATNGLCHTKKLLSLVIPISSSLEKKSFSISQAIFFSSFLHSFLSSCPLPSFLPLLPSFCLFFFLSQEPVLVRDGCFLKKHQSTSNMFYKEERLSHTWSGRLLWYLLIFLGQPGIHTRKRHPWMWSFVKSKLLCFASWVLIIGSSAQAHTAPPLDLDLGRSFCKSQHF